MHHLTRPQAEPSSDAKLTLWARAPVYQLYFSSAPGKAGIQILTKTEPEGGERSSPLGGLEHKPHLPWGCPAQGPPTPDCGQNPGFPRPVGGTEAAPAWGKFPQKRIHGPACWPADPIHPHPFPQACSLQTSSDRPPEAATTRLPSAQIPFSTLWWLRVQMVLGGSVGTCTRMVLSVDVVYKAPRECLIPVI